MNTNALKTDVSRSELLRLDTPATIATPIACRSCHSPCIVLIGQPSRPPFFRCQECGAEWERAYRPEASGSSQG